MRWFCFVCVGLEIVCKRARDQILVIGGGGGGWWLVILKSLLIVFISQQL